MKSLMDLVKAAKAEITEIDADTLQQKIDAGEDLLLVDLREPAETAGGVIPGCIQVPRGMLEPAADLDYSGRNTELSAARDRSVVLYCASGGRSALAAATLQEMGFKNVASLAGGMTGWTKGERAVAS